MKRNIRDDILRRSFKSHSNVMLAGLSFDTSYCVVEDAEGEVIGVLNTKITDMLRKLQELESLEVKAIMKREEIKSATKAWKKTDKVTRFPIEFNVYGHRYNSESVDSILSSSHVYLQPPQTIVYPVPYENPQYFMLPGIDVVMEEVKSLEEATGMTESTVQLTDIETVLDHLPQQNYLRHSFTSDSIVATLKKSCLPCSSGDFGVLTEP
jgi:hypothetical protein